MPAQGTDHGPPAVLVAVVPLRVARREASEVLLPTSLVVALVARIARLERAGVDKEERDVGVGEGEALFVDGVRDVLWWRRADGFVWGRAACMCVCVCVCARARVCVLGSGFKATTPRRESLPADKSNFAQDKKRHWKEPR